MLLLINEIVNINAIGVMFFTEVEKNQLCETVRLYEDFILNIYKNDINVNQ